MAINGSCLCGSVRYRIDGELALPGNCHCSICRKTHGAAFGTYATAKLSEFQWVAGENLISKFESTPDNFRYFCSRCGSPLCSIFASEPNDVGVVLGSVDGDPGVRPMAHIFVASKAPWFEISDDLMKFEAWPPGMGPGQG